MWKSIVGLSVLIAAALHHTAAAQPVHLKFVNAYPANDDYLARWVATVNEAAPDEMVITFHDSKSELARDQLGQLSLVRSGIVDIALVITNYHPNDFPDDDLPQLPGMFRTATDGSVTMWRLYEQGLLRGYDGFAVLTIRTSASSYLHTAFPVINLNVLTGKRIRVGTTLLSPLPDEFAAEPVFLPVAEVRENFISGKLDGVITVPAALYSGSRIADVAKHHLMAPLGQFALALLMNEPRFDSLGAEARAALRAHSGGALALAWGRQIDDQYRRDLERMATSPGHVVRSLGLGELERWLEATRSVIDDWIALDPHHAKVVAAAHEEMRRLHPDGL